MTNPMNLESIREEFPALAEKTFLDAACVSLAPRRAVRALADFSQRAMLCPERSSTLHHLAMDEARSRARPKAARLLGCDEEEIALVESTTHGLNIAAQSIPLAAGDRVIIPAMEFIEVALPWKQLSVTRGILVDIAPHRDGRVEIEDIAAQFRPRTRVVVLSAVQWNNGFRCDLAKLSALCRESGVWLVVDAIQQLGAIPLRVRETPVDFLACGGHKWLNSPFGAGLLYIRRECLSRLLPPLSGYLGLADPQGGWGTYFETPSISPLDDHEIAPGARRYETGGTSNYPGAVALAASLSLLNEAWADAIASRILALGDRLIAGLETLRVRLVTPVAHEHRSGIVTFTLGGVRENLALMEHLLEQKILVSVRYSAGVGGVRVSLHLFNSVEDADRLLNAAGEYLRSH